MILVCALMLAGPALKVSETAGIRRFTYPVTAVLPAQVARQRWRLLENGKPVAAQFSEGEVDFAVSLGPFEQRGFTLEALPEGAAAKVELPREVVAQEANQFVVSFTGSMQYGVPRSLLGFLDSVKTAKWDYLRPGSQGLLLRYRDDIVYRAGGAGPHGAPTQARVVKQGPLTATIDFTSTEALRGSRSVPSTVRMEFPRSKSWVKATWTVEDPEALVSGLGLDLNLNLSAPPALVDFGGASIVYSQLRPGQTAALIAGPQSWRVLVGPDPYVTGAGGTAEGWAHLMDRDRATAVSVEDFGRRQDRIEASADGRLQIWREFRGSGAKTLAFWLHFVTMPVQIGAATSPQAMLAPLKVEWTWTP